MQISYKPDVNIELKELETPEGYKPIYYNQIRFFCRKENVTVRCTYGMEVLKNLNLGQLVSILV